MKKGNVKLNFSPLVTKKIDWMTEIRPTKEWSGIIFYKILQENDIYKIEVVDLVIMDFLGNSVHTQFREDDPYLSIYKDENRKLVKCYTGLLHSHHMMSCGPSPEDEQTMQKEAKAKDRTNFLSIIVYNKRKDYSCRISQINTTNETVVIDTKTTTTIESSNNSFGNITDKESVTDVKESTEKKENSKTSVEIIDIPWSDVTLSEPSWTENERRSFLKRVFSIRHVDHHTEGSWRSSTNTSTSTGIGYKPSAYSAYNHGSDYDYDYGYDWDEYDNTHSNSYYGTLSVTRYSEKSPEYVAYILLNNKLSMESQYSNVVTDYMINNSVTYFGSSCNTIYGGIENYKKYGNKFIVVALNLYAKKHFGSKNDKKFRANVYKAYLIIMSKHSESPYINALKESLQRFLLSERIIKKR